MFVLWGNTACEFAFYGNFVEMSWFADQRMKLPNTTGHTKVFRFV